MFKKFCISFLCLILAFIIAAGSAVYVIDPFNVFRAEKDIKKIIYQIPYYQNIGIARYADYDVLVTGTSMTQNFRAWWFNEKTGCNAVRLSFDGGIVSDFEQLLKVALSRESVKKVYFGLDNYLITADSKLNDISDRIPDYEIETNPLYKVKYLLNKDIIFKYIPTYFSYKNLPEYDFYEMHAWDRTDNNFSKEIVLSDFKISEYEKTKKQDYFISSCDNFLNSVGKLAEENKDVEFVFFAPPYSIIYWYNQLKSGTLDATIYSLKYVYKELLKNENVHIFYFQNNYNMITDLDKYKDANHYCTDYNKYMLDCFCSGENEITADSYVGTLDEMKSFAESYDYAQYAE